MKRVDVVSAIIISPDDQSVLIVQNNKKGSTYWSLPGGAVEAGETLEQAAIRETKEETGYDVEILCLHSVREAFYVSRGHHAIIFTFMARVVGGELTIMDPDQDIVDVRWVDLPTAFQLIPKLERLRLSSSGNVQETGFYSYEGNISG